MVSSFARDISAFAVGAALVLAASPASAHFDLMTPASWSVDDQTDGTPEKLGPCGNELENNKAPMLALDDAGLPIITAYQEGGMITVTIEEVVFHPGHYRISLSTDWADAGDTVQAGFPPDPVVTPGGTNSGTMVCPGGAKLDNACGSVPITPQTPVALPGVGWVLADDVFEHCDPFTAPQTIKVALPAGVTCKECVLQVLEFMSDHGLNPQGGCFYHHCANLSIAGQSVPVEAGASSGASSGGTSGASSGGVSGTTGSPGGSTGATAGTGSTETSGSTVPSGSTGSVVGSGEGVGAGSTAATGTSGSASGSSSEASGAGTTPSAPAKSGCSISTSAGGGSFGASLAGLALAAALSRRRREEKTD